MSIDYDLLIVCGGLAGNCLALALKDCGLHLAIVEANTQEQLRSSPAGDRALALAAGTVAVLEQLEVWQGVKQQASAIKQIHISDRGHFGKTRLSASREKVDALGYVITARAIETHVANQVQQARIDVICPARVTGLISGPDAVHANLKQGDDSFNVSAKLLVGADGGQSSIRKLLDIGQHLSDYDQTALVTTVKSQLPNNHTAYERFTISGPLALLPVGSHHSAVVWTRSTDDAQALMAGNDADFLAELQDCFGYRLGELAMTEPKRAFPLTLIRAEKMLSGRAVIIGNAAHQLHPVAGQGFNLGLRDVVQLAEMLITQHESGGDIGDTGFLNRYAQARQQDHDKTIFFTDQVVRIFSNDWFAMAAARNFGLLLLDHIPAAKAFLARHAMGLAEHLPKPAKR
jgi:2-octaprenyl-6-methoxyphenol hydroxylase